MHKDVFIALLEFNRGGKEDQDSFIQKALNLCKTFNQRRQRTISSSKTCKRGKKVKGYHCFSGKLYPIKEMKDG